MGKIQNRATRHPVTYANDATREFILPPVELHILKSLYYYLTVENGLTQP